MTKKTKVIITATLTTVFIALAIASFFMPLLTVSSAGETVRASVFDVVRSLAYSNGIEVGLTGDKSLMLGYSISSGDFFPDNFIIFSYFGLLGAGLIALITSICSFFKKGQKTCIAFSAVSVLFSILGMFCTIMFIGSNATVLNGMAIHAGTIVAVIASIFALVTSILTRKFTTKSKEK